MAFINDVKSDKILLRYGSFIDSRYFCDWSFEIKYTRRICLSIEIGIHNWNKIRHLNTVKIQDSRFKNSLLSQYNIFSR